MTRRNELENRIKRLEKCFRNERNIRDLDAAIVAIVTLRHKFEMARDATYQVVLDPSLLSGTKDHIRLGNYEGDELRGWYATADIEIREKLSDYPPKRAA